MFKTFLSTVSAVVLSTMVLVGVATTPARAAEQAYYDIKELVSAKENYDYVRSLMVLMNENRPLEEINKIVYEVEQYTIIADDLLEVATVFYQEGPELKLMRAQTAKTHLLLVAFYIYQKNFSGAMEHFRLAEEIYPEMYEDTELEIEVKASRDKGVRNLVRYDMKDVQQFKSWYEGDVGTGGSFEVEVAEDFVPNTIADAKIVSLDVLSPQSNAFRLLELANNEMNKQLAENKRYFRLTLAPGNYQLQNETATLYAQKFSIAESDQQPFTVFLQPDKSFSLRFAESYKADRAPKLFYNGILMTEESFAKMPYGEYEVKADRKYFDFEYGKIQFVPIGEGETDEVTAGAGVQIIPVAEGTTFTLDLGKKGFFQRAIDRSAD